MKKLVVFSRSYPYTDADEWKSSELHAFQAHFDDVVVAPLMDGGQPVAADFPRGIRLLPPAISADNDFASKKAVLTLLGPRLVTHFISLKGGPKTEHRRLRKWLISRVNVENILRSNVFKNNVAPELQGSCLYFWWGYGYAEVLPYLPSHARRKSFVRFHRYDLYWDQNGGYIPSQSSIVENAAILAPVSEHGANFLRSKYYEHAHKVQLHRLGTSKSAASRPSPDKILRIVSCAFVNQVKRLHLIADCIQHVDEPLEWTHIGDGPLLADLIDSTRQLPTHIRCNFVGRMTQDQIKTLYEIQPFDVFVSVSGSEGIPLSIMEAMAAGIPVLATDVGGTSELVDDCVGCLLRVDFTPEEFVRKLKKMASLSHCERSELRAKSSERIARDYDIITNSERLAATLESLCQNNQSAV